MFGLSVLGEGHDQACQRLSGPEAGRFVDIDWFVTDQGAVLLRGAPAWFECQLEAEVPAEDHLIALFRIREAALRPHVAPPVFHRSGYRKLHSLA